MTPIVTRELVRRYLIATKRQACAARFGSQFGGVVSERAERSLMLDRAVLGVLAAADDLLDRADDYFVRGDGLLGTSKAADGMRLVVMAGVDVDAWQKARSL